LVVVVDDERAEVLRTVSGSVLGTWTEEEVDEQLGMACAPGRKVSSPVPTPWKLPSSIRFERNQNISSWCLLLEVCSLLRANIEMESSAEIWFPIKRDLEGATSYRWMDGCEEESLLCRFREFLVSRFFVTKTLRRFGTCV
jgi:hypothetical protein